MSHPIVHIELTAENLKDLAKFYTDTFGWSIQEFPEMNYITFSSGEGAVGGGFTPAEQGVPPGTVVSYIQCEDIQAHLEKIEGNGGKILRPPMEVPGVGQIAHFFDPSGNRMALLQPVVEE
jgi:predicted enzyme related to lactoylglutathione lyase